MIETEPKINREPRSGRGHTRKESPQNREDSKKDPFVAEDEGLPAMEMPGPEEETLEEKIFQAERNLERDYDVKQAPGAERAKKLDKEIPYLPEDEEEAETLFLPDDTEEEEENYGAAGNKRKTGSRKSVVDETDIPEASNKPSKMGAVRFIAGEFLRTVKKINEEIDGNPKEAFWVGSATATTAPLAGIALGLGTIPVFGLVGAGVYLIARGGYKWYQKEKNKETVE